MVIVCFCLYWPDFITKGNFLLFNYIISLNQFVLKFQYLFDILLTTNFQNIEVYILITLKINNLCGAEAPETFICKNFGTVLPFDILNVPHSCGEGL